LARLALGGKHLKENLKIYDFVGKKNCLIWFQGMNLGSRVSEPWNQGKKPLNQGLIRALEPGWQKNRQ
jgi:hypothetical protein